MARLLNIDNEVVASNLSAIFLLLTTNDPDSIRRVVSASAARHDIFGIQANLFVCVIDCNQRYVFEVQVWCDHTEQRLHLLCTRHIGYRLLIHSIFNFFLRSQVTNRINNNNNTVFLINTFKLFHDIKLQLFNIGNWCVNDLCHIDTKRFEIRLWCAELGVIEQNYSFRILLLIGCCHKQSKCRLEVLRWPRKHQQAWHKPAIHTTR